MNYEYRVVQIPPNITIKSKVQKENKADYYLETKANQKAMQCWDFYRIAKIRIVAIFGWLTGQ